MNVDSRLGADFFEQNLIIVGEVGAFLFGYISLFYIYFISEESDNDSLSPLIFDIINPFLDAIERNPIGNIIHDDCDRRISNIIGNQCSKPLLACGVPELKADGFLLQEDILGDEIDANGGPLHNAGGT